MTNSPDDRSPLAEAVAWSSVVTTVSLEMVVPALIGYWIDRQLGTVMVFLVLGAILGMTTGILHLVRLTTLPSPGARRGRRSSDDDRKP